MKKLLILLLFIPIISNAQIKGMLDKAKSKVSEVTKNKNLSNADIGNALKEALNKGVTDQVAKLTATDGFYRNEAVKILLPTELQKVDNTLRKMGMSNLADEGIKVLNRAAEDAVKKATPIFVTAIKNITIADAKNILMGSDNSATTYLQNNTSKTLYAKFSPVVTTSLSNVGADKIWENIINKYNDIPLTSKVNPDLSDYVTTRALEGVFKMIAVEETNIRTNFSSRTSELLKKVFALQD